MPAHHPEEIHALLGAAFSARDVDAVAELAGALSRDASHVDTVAPGRHVRNPRNLGLRAARWMVAPAATQRLAAAGHDRGARRVPRRHGPPGPDRRADHGRQSGPIVEALARIDVSFAREWWHWFFLGQTGKPAEKVIAAIGPSPQTTPTAPGGGPRSPPSVMLFDPYTIRGASQQEQRPQG